MIRPIVEMCELPPKDVRAVDFGEVAWTGFDLDRNQLAGRLLVH